MGKRGPEVSILGFGCMRLPVIDNDESKINEPEATRLLRYAIDHGVNYVDTAWGYHGGNSELWLGRALGDGYREKVFLATKLPSWLVETRDDCDKLLARQLERLQTDHIDFYLLHAVNKKNWETYRKIGVGDFLDSALNDGRIKYAGFSFHDTYEVFERVINGYDWTFCQIQYNFMDEHEQAGRKGLELAAGKGIGVIVMEPLRGGNLAKEPPREIKKIWKSAPVNRSYAEWALRWVWNHPDVSMLLSGMNAIEQVKENIAIASQVQPGCLLSNDLPIFAKVREAFRARIPVECTGCGYCMPCPYGVNIPICHRFYNEAVMYDNKASAKRVYHLLLKPENQASSCVECGECEEKCPQNIQIMNNLKKVHTLLGGK